MNWVQEQYNNKNLTTNEADKLWKGIKGKEYMKEFRGKRLTFNKKWLQMKQINLGKRSITKSTFRRKSEKKERSKIAYK